MKKIVLILFCLCFIYNSWSQDSPYKNNTWKDGAYIAGTLDLNVLGFTFIQNKESLTEVELAALDKNDIAGINRWAAGSYSEKTDAASYIPFYAALAMPLAFLPSEAERKNFGQISVLFVETMATTGVFYTMTAGLIDKSIPLVYNEDLPLGERVEGGAQRSFIAEHTGVAAAGSFFAAKIFNDFHPDYKAIPYVWGGATGISVLMGYLRTKAGKHFLTNNIAGMIVGAASGILIPELHKKGKENIDVYPTASFNVNWHKHQGLCLFL
ncbi:phosphatase PAP2 family protein [Salegentibacter salegens]|jgi:membrane-associated phospholipid phosphatase|uniref:PAP2 superfamily protein n=1 Tax=Salegentibacter salegens TaxID=143223 RepID=A0A1M7HFG7_9FLAO|nr:phosphatase PAP2 family protein [Salegentibacter salegens]PRX44095.1 PAP2 superfamily protein [Salegentibacter salegens]SHM27103.1 PAP2 superfamily protein [Salegentibacter salegens]